MQRVDGPLRGGARSSSRLGGLQGRLRPGRQLHDAIPEHGARSGQHRPPLRRQLPAARRKVQGFRFGVRGTRSNRHAIGYLKCKAGRCPEPAQPIATRQNPASVSAMLAAFPGSRALRFVITEVGSERQGGGVERGGGGEGRGAAAARSTSGAAPGAAPSRAGAAPRGGCPLWVAGESGCSRSSPAPPPRPPPPQLSSTPLASQATRAGKLARRRKPGRTYWDLLGPTVGPCPTGTVVASGHAEG